MARFANTLAVNIILLRPLSIAALFFITSSFPIGLYAQEEFWGITSNSNNGGTIFNSSATIADHSTQYEFIIGNVGAFPKGCLVETSPGQFYGLTNLGGVNDVGVLFSFKNGLYTKRIDFDRQLSGAHPAGTLVMASNGKLYGVTSSGGVNDNGVLFEYDINSNSLTKKCDFDGIGKGATPYGKLTLAPNGKLYGTTSAGGLYNGGVLFEFNPTDGSYTKKIDFSPSTGFNPVGSLCRALNGKLYGISRTGGDKSTGTIFSFDSSHGTFEKCFDLLEDMRVSSGGLTEVLFGRFYFAINVENASGINGAIFEYNDNTRRLQKKVNFETSDGSFAYSDLAFRNDGLYGTASRGGLNNKGTIFYYSPLYERFNKIYDFENEKKGIYPNGLTVGADGNLYGMTEHGGSNLKGTYYRVEQSDNSVTHLFDFSNAFNGAFPFGKLLMASDGNFYCMTTNGGSYGRGVLFQYDNNSKTLVKKIDFDGLNGDNSSTASVLSLMQASNGKLYGMTARGGIHNYGVLFEYDLINDIYTKKTDFDSQIQPVGKLVESSAGKLYGVGAGGVIFCFDFLSNTLAIKFNMTLSSGLQPRSGLVMASNDKMYGLTVAGGANNDGVLFEFDPVNDAHAVRHNFNNTTGGASPYGSLTEGLNGKLYGTTYNGGLNQNGTLFEFDLATGNFETKVEFDPLTIGSKSTSDVTLSATGKLYAMTIVGGSNNGGTLFEYNPATSGTTKVLDFTRNNYVQSLVSVTLKLYQDITFNAIPEKKYGDLPFDITEASASSGLSLLYASSDPTIASVSGTSITIKKAGSCWISAYQAGNNSYYSTSAKQLLVIKKAVPVINWSNPTPISYGTRLTASQLNAASTVSGTFKYEPAFNTLLNGGENQLLTVSFSPDDDINYSSLENINVSITVNKIPLTITANDTVRKYGTNNPMFTVSYKGLINNDDQKSIQYLNLTTTASLFSNTGEYPITLTGGSSQNYTLTLVNGTLNVKKAEQTIVFDSIPNQQLEFSTVILSAFSNSGLPIQFSTTSPSRIHIVHDVAMPLEGGSVTIKAMQEGNSNYNSASAERTFCIIPKTPSITRRIESNKIILQTNTSQGSKWFFNQTIIAEDTSQVAVEEGGKYSVQVTTDNCVSDSKTILVQIVDGSSDGIAIIPNPVNHYLNVSGLPNTNISANIIDATGKIQALKLFNMGIFRSDVSTLAPGLYILSLSFDNQLVNLRFIKN